MKHTFLFLFGVIVTSSLFFISCNNNNNAPDFTETLPEPEPEPLPIILPIPEVYITTPENVGITSKTTWVKNSSIKIIDEYGEEHNINTSIKGRGNTTWNYPKKPYAIKLDSKEESYPSNWLKEPNVYVWAYPRSQSLSQISVCKVFWHSSKSSYRDRQSGPL